MDSPLPETIESYLARGLSTTYEMMRSADGGSDAVAGRVLTEERVSAMWNSFISVVDGSKMLRLLRDTVGGIVIQKPSSSPSLPHSRPAAFMDGDVFSAVPYVLTTFLPTLSGACARAVLDGHITPPTSERIVVFTVQVIAEMFFLPVTGEAPLESILWGGAVGSGALVPTPTSIRDVSCTSAMPSHQYIDNFLDVRDLLLQCCSTTPREVVMSLGLTRGVDTVDELNPSVEPTTAEDDDHRRANNVADSCKVEVSAQMLNQDDEVLQQSICSLRTHILSCATSSFYRYLLHAMYLREGARVLLAKSKSQLQELRATPSTLDDFNGRVWFGLWRTLVPSVLLLYTECVVVPVAELRYRASEGSPPANELTTPSTAKMCAASTSLSSSTPEAVLRSLLLVRHIAPFCQYVTTMTLQGISQLLLQPTATVTPMFQIPADVSNTAGGMEDGNPTTWHNTIADISITLLSEVYGLLAASDAYVSHFGTSLQSNTGSGVTTTPLAFMRAKMLHLNAQKKARLESQVTSIVRRQLPVVLQQQQQEHQESGAVVDEVEVAASLTSSVRTELLSRAQRPSDTVALHTGSYPLIPDNEGDTPHSEAVGPSTTSSSLHEVINTCVGDLLAAHPPTSSPTSPSPTSMLGLALYSASTYWSAVVLVGAMDGGGAEGCGGGITSPSVDDVRGRRNLVQDATVFSGKEQNDSPNEKKSGVADCEELKLLQQYRLEGSSSATIQRNVGGGVTAPYNCWGTEHQIPWSRCAVAGVVSYRLSRVLAAMTVHLPWSGCSTLSDVPKLLNSLEEYRDGIVLSELYDMTEGDEVCRTTMLYGQTLHTLLGHLRECAVHVLGEAAVQRGCNGGGGGAGGLLGLLGCLYSGRSSGLNDVNEIITRIYREPPRAEEIIKMPQSAASQLRESISKEAGVLRPTYRVNPSSTSAATDDGVALSWWLSSAVRFADTGATSAVHDELANIIFRAFDIPLEDEYVDEEDDFDEGCGDDCHKLSVELLRCCAPQAVEGGSVTEGSLSVELPPLPLMSPVTVVSVIYQALSFSSQPSQLRRDIASLKGSSVFEGVMLCLTHCLRVESVQPCPIPTTHHNPPPTTTALPQSTLSLMMRALLVAHAYLVDSGTDVCNDTSLRLPSDLYDFPKEYIPAHIQRADLSRRLVAARRLPASSLLSSTQEQTAFMSMGELMAMMALAGASQSDEGRVDPKAAITELASYVSGDDRTTLPIQQCCPSVVRVLRSYGVKPVSTQPQHHAEHDDTTNSNPNGILVSMLSSGPSAEMVHRLLAAGILPITSFTHTVQSTDVGYPRTRFDGLVDAACCLSTTHPHVLERDEHHAALLDVLCSEAHEGELYGDVTQLWRSPEFKTHVDFLQTLLTLITTVTSIEHRELATSVFEGAMRIYTPRIKGKMLMVLLSGSPHPTVQSVLLNTLSTSITAAYSATPTTTSVQDHFVSHQMAHSFIDIATLAVDNIVAKHQHQSQGHVDSHSQEHQQPILLMKHPDASDDDDLVSNVTFILRFLNIMQSLIVGELAAVKKVLNRDLLLSPSYMNNKDGHGSRPFRLWRLHDSMLAIGMMPVSPSFPDAPKAVVLRRATFLQSQKSLSAICAHLIGSVLAPLRTVLSSTASKISDLDKFGLERIMDLFSSLIYVQE